MPYAIVVPLVPIDATPLPPSLGTCTESALSAFLGRLTPERSGALRSVGEAGALAAAVLRARPARGAPPAPILRLCVLDDALVAPFVAGPVGEEPTVVRLGDAELTLGPIRTHTDAHPLAGSATYEELREQALAPDRLVVRFVTPTVLKAQGRDALSPSPRLLLQSWVRAWNACADPRLAIDEQALVTDLAPRLTISRLRIETRRAPLSDGMVVGFVGDVTLDLKAADPDERRHVAALAMLSFYSGTGLKTAAGMGQTRPVGRLTPANRQGVEE